MSGFDLTAIATLATNIAALLPTTFKFQHDGGTASANMTGSKTTVRAEKILDKYGTLAGYALSLIVPTAQFSSSRPVAGDVVTISSTRYRVLGVDSDAAGATIRMDLKDEFGG
jgi:hypothetical protein